MSYQSPSRVSHTTMRIATVYRGLTMGGEAPGGIGYPHRGRLISQDVVRFQRVIGTLHRQGVLAELSAAAHPLTLEIGSGYKPMPALDTVVRSHKGGVRLMLQRGTKL